MGIVFEMLVNFLLFFFLFIQKVLFNLVLHFLSFLINVSEIQEERKSNLFCVFDGVSLFDFIVVNKWKPLLSGFKTVLWNQVFAVRDGGENIITNTSLDLFSFLLIFYQKLVFLSFQNSSEILFTMIDGHVEV